MDPEDLAYLEFLKQYGHWDFSLLGYLPKLQTIEEFEEMKKEKFLKCPKIMRTTSLIGNNFDIEKDRHNGRLRLLMMPKDIRKKENQQKPEPDNGDQLHVI